VTDHEAIHLSMLLDERPAAGASGPA
jgi:hypothetical protein